MRLRRPLSSQGLRFLPAAPLGWPSKCSCSYSQTLCGPVNWVSHECSEVLRAPESAGVQGMNCRGSLHHSTILTA